MSFLNHRYAAALAAAALTASCTATAYAYVQPIYLEINQSYYLPQTSVIKRVAVSNPAIADVVVVSKREINIIAKQNGTTSLTIWTTNGMRQEFTVNVNPSDTGTALAIQKAIGLPHVQVQKVGDKILLRGTVRNQYEKTLAFRVASMYTKQANEKMNQRNIKMGSGQTSDGGVGTDINTEEGTDSSENVINLLEMVNPDQINIEAMVLEIRVKDAEELGERYASVDPSADNTSSTTLGSVGQFYFGETYGAQRSKGSHWYSRNWLFAHFSQINAQLNLLITEGKARVISRPNITTMSGKTAGIFIGGEVPYPRRENNSTTTDYKKYGVQLDLRKPVVDTSGNITAELDATVSRLDWENAVTADGFRAPALKTRQATTTVNIPSGMTMAIGGLLNSEDSKTLSKVPLLGDIPILGELFKYHNNSHEDTELLILITPRVVNEETPASMSPSMEDWYAENRQADKRRAAVDLNSAAPPKTRAQKKAEERAKAAAAEKNQDKHAAKLSEQEDSLLGKYLNQKVLAGATPEEKEAAEKN